MGRHRPGRDTTSQRGYGPRHQALREQWRPDVEAGRVSCARCHLPIAPGERWDLGHDDDRSKYTGPEHQECNRGASNRRPDQVTPAIDPPATLGPEWDD